jgi:large subunit ribosomal protein L24e
MTKDTFTGEEVSPHKGIHLIKNDGTIEYYSSSKSRKNALKLRRDKRKLKWTEAFRLVRQHAERERAKHAVVKQETVPKVEEKKDA